MVEQGSIYKVSFILVDSQPKWVYPALQGQRALLELPAKLRVPYVLV